MNTNSRAADVIERDAIAALERGRLPESLAAWRRLLALQPEHLLALKQSGQLAFRLGDFAAARQSFERLAAVDGRDPRDWINLAFACQRLQDEAGEEAALTKALTVDPYDLLALLLRGALQERQGRTAQAAASYGAAATVAPDADRLPPELQQRLLHAMQFRDDHRRRFADFIDGQLAPHLGASAHGGALDRFRLSLDILLGRKQRYESRPMQYFVPALVPVEFFDRTLFPWIDAVESETDAIRDEFLQLLRADDESFVPYITYRADQPLAQWAELNHSPKWSAVHLIKDGLRVDANAGRCPRTMAALAGVPQPDQPGRTPSALYSLLKPRTRIPPHVGVSNARLVAHLPLIVPAGCRYRVGNTWREWEPGRVWVFDDTIEHEAWNDSDAIRVVLIFDVWHPALNADERRLITALSTALNAFSGGADAGYGV